MHGYRLKAPCWPKQVGPDTTMCLLAVAGACSAPPSLLLSPTPFHLHVGLACSGALLLVFLSVPLLRLSVRPTSGCRCCVSSWSCAYIYRSRGCAASANSAKSAKSASPSKAHKQSTSSKSGSSKRRGSKDSKRIQEGKRGSGNAAGSPPQSGGDGREAAAAGGDGVATWAGNNSAAGLAEQRDAAVHSSQQKIKVVLANQ